MDRDVIGIMNINNRIVETHHQLACAPFCHATSKNGMNKKIVTIGRIFDRNLMTCWFWIFRWSMEKKEKTKLSVASVSATHSYESRYRSKSRIDSWFRGWQIEIESCPLSDSIFIRRIIPEHDGFFLFLSSFQSCFLLHVCRFG